MTYFKGVQSFSFMFLLCLLHATFITITVAQTTTPRPNSSSSDKTEDDLWKTIFFYTSIAATSLSVVLIVGICIYCWNKRRPIVVATPSGAPHMTAKARFIGGKKYVPVTINPHGVDDHRIVNNV